MNTFDLIVQGAGFLAMVCNLLAFQQRKRSGLIVLQLLGSVLFAFQFLMLEAYMGFFLNLAGILRALVFLFKEKTHAEHPGWTAGFVAVYLCAYVLTFTWMGKGITAANLLTEFLPVLAMTVSTLSLRKKEARIIRLYALINIPLWLVYNILSHSIGATLCELLSLGSVLLGMYRLDRKEKIQ